MFASSLNFILLRGFGIAVFFGCAFLTNGFGQLTTSAAQSSDAATSSDGFTFLSIALALLSASFVASIFWWRREKVKTAELPRRAPSKKPALTHENKFARDKQAANANSQMEIEVDDEMAAWVQNNLNNRRSSAEAKTEVKIEPPANSTHKTSAASPVETAPQSIPHFAALKSPSPLVPLPLMDDEALLEAVELVQDFDASEIERQTAISILSTFKSRNAAEALAGVALYDESPFIRIEALNMLGEFNHESTFEPILLACADPAREVRAAAARGLSRLNINRAEAYARVIASDDPERLRLASLGCREAGLAKYSFDRLIAADKQQSDEAFAVLSLIVAAGDFALVVKTLLHHADINVKLATIQALHALKPSKHLPELYEITANENLPVEIRRALDSLVDVLSSH